LPLEGFKLLYELYTIIMAKKKSKKARISPKTVSKQSSKPVISVKINESARIEKPLELDEPETRQEGKTPEKPGKDSGSQDKPCNEPGKTQDKPESNLKYAVIGVLIVLAFIAATVFLKGNAGNFQDSKFPMLTDDVMVCNNNNAICFLQNGSWYSIGYTMGTDLNAANNYYISADTVAGVNSLFSKDKINLVFGSVEGTDPNNAQLITTASPFSYYLGVYYVYEGQNKTISPYLLKEYNSSEPALIILGPGTGANETSLVFDGKNVVVQGETYEDLKLVLGKLLIVAIRED